MKQYKITLISGDGIGPEIISVAKDVIEKTGVKIAWDIQEVDDIEKIITSIKKNKIAFKGPITTPIGSGCRSINVKLRKEWDLFVNLRPAKSYPGVKSKYKDIDLVIIRENIEDLYVGIEFKQGDAKTSQLIEYLEKISGQNIRKDSGISIKPISVFGSKRIVRFAFEYAVKNNRKRITVVHKANIMKYTDGLFLETARQVAKKYPSIEFEERVVDNMAAQLVQKPGLYDVLVCPNLYGDIISDLAAGLVGGLGLTPAANIGSEYAIFEPVHGSAPKYAGQNKVNPTATILAGAMMLKFLGEEESANQIEQAVSAVIKEGKSVTYDLRQSSDDLSAVGTKEMGAAIIKEVGLKHNL